MQYKNGEMYFWAALAIAPAETSVVAKVASIFNLKQYSLCNIAV